MAPKHYIAVEDIKAVQESLLRLHQRQESAAELFSGTSPATAELHRAMARCYKTALDILRNHSEHRPMPAGALVWTAEPPAGAGWWLCAIWDHTNGRWVITGSLLDDSQAAYRRKFLSGSGRVMWAGPFEPPCSDGLKQIGLPDSQAVPIWRRILRKLFKLST